MGLIKAAKDSIESLLADQWREYFYCDSLSDSVLMTKAQKKVSSGRNSNTKGSENIISDGSVIAVNEGQCMIIVEQGEIVEFSADAGKFVYDSSTEASLLTGELDENTILDTVKNLVNRFSFGGNTGNDQRVYFFNIKEIKGNLFGTRNPIPFRVVDTNVGLDLDTTARCNGSYSFKIVDPLVFYKNVCGNVTHDYKTGDITGFMKDELVDALQPALAKISAQGVRYSAIPDYADDITEILNEELKEAWFQNRGIQIVSMNLNPITIPEEDEKMFRQLQQEMAKKKSELQIDIMKNQNGLLGVDLEKQRIAAMHAAASNDAVGPMFAFANMNMAGAATGMYTNQNVQASPVNMAAQMYTMNQVDQMQNGWTCSCGQVNTGKFCTECGGKKPEVAQNGWTCSCGHVNTGKFCEECGAKKPEAVTAVKCSKCGWTPENPSQTPKFCPECGESF
ncbi:MAG: SPFH domain-containing protein [Lachnospiraceae bacterium]|nr:SPFH domain-containing protein [Lachnospiraceae bacterium]